MTGAGHIECRGTIRVDRDRGSDRWLTAAAALGVPSHSSVHAVDIALWDLGCDVQAGECTLTVTSLSSSQFHRLTQALAHVAEAGQELPFTADAEHRRILFHGRGVEVLTPVEVWAGDPVVTAAGQHLASAIIAGQLPRESRLGRAAIALLAAITPPAAATSAA